MTIEEIKRVAFNHTTTDEEIAVIQDIKLGDKLLDTGTGDVYKVTALHITGVLADRYTMRKFIKYRAIAEGDYAL